MLGEYDTEHNFKPTVDDHLHLRLHTLPPQVSSSTICSVFERPSVCGAHHGYPPPNTVIFTWAKPHKSWLMDARLCRPDIQRPLQRGRGFETDSQDRPSSKIPNAIKDVLGSPKTHRLRYLELSTQIRGLRTDHPTSQPWDPLGIVPTRQTGFWWT